jgi:arginase
MRSKYIIGAMCRAGQKKAGPELAPSFFPLKHVIESDAFDQGTGYQELYDVVKKSYSTSGDRIIVCGGDHSISTSSVGAINDRLIEKKQNLHVVWVDAHADINTFDSSLTGSTHGMPVAFLTGLCDSPNVLLANKLRPNQLTYIGLRDVDPAEVRFIKDLGIRFYTARQVKQHGIGRIMEQVQKVVGSDYVHVSMDVDSMDPLYCPSTGTAVAGGLTVDDCLAVINGFDKRLFRSMDVTEFNGLIGTKQDVDQTVDTVRKLIDAF